MPKRSFNRFNTHMKATYYLEERNRGWEDCTITKLSRKGMGITFHTEEQMSPESILHIKIFTSNENEYFTVKGDLRWIEKAEHNFVGGIELREILDEAKWLQLIYFIEHSTDKQIKNPRACAPKKKSKGSSVPPQKVIVPPTPLEQIKAILNYKIM